MIAAGPLWNLSVLARHGRFQAWNASPLSWDAGTLFLWQMPLEEGTESVALTLRTCISATMTLCLRLTRDSCVFVVHAVLAFN